jgi:tetratricopeptide (TPR) repeat protein
MPFSSQFRNQWRLAIKPAIENASLSPRRADDEELGTNIIMRDVTSGIYIATVVVADVTGRNPNVMYELGLAHAAKKPVIILKEESEDVPFDVSHIRYLDYDPLDLASLREDLTQRLNSTLTNPEQSGPDLFPELEIMTKEKKEELDYLRKQSRAVQIDVHPPTAYVFFNNNLIGQGSQELIVNMDAPKNVLSVTSAEHLEYYENLTEDLIQSGQINVELEPGRARGPVEKRMPKWLRLRREDPDNPVLMKAISQYLTQIDALDEALEEAQDLVSSAPSWCVSHGHLGDVYHRMGEYEEAIKHLNTSVSLDRDYTVGYLGLACSYSQNKDFDKCIDVLSKIRDREDLLVEYLYMGPWRIENDDDMIPIKNSDKYGSRYESLIDQINSKLDKIDERTENGN